MEFIDSPPGQRRKNGRVDWQEVMATLKANPGEWAYIDDFNPSVATHIRQGRYPFINPLDYEVTSRGTGVKNVSSVYMKYIGPGDDD